MTISLARDDRSAYLVRMTPQEKMQAKLSTLKIPAREIKVFGSQILVTCACIDTANKWARVLAKFATVRGVVHSVDYAKSEERLLNARQTIDVWRVGAYV